MVSAGGPQWRGTHDQWLVKRLNPVPVVIGDDFDGLFCGPALLGLKSLSHPLTTFLAGVGLIGFWLLLAFSRSLGFSSLACVLACLRCFPISLDRPGSTFYLPVTYCYYYYNYY